MNLFLAFILIIAEPLAGVAGWRVSFLFLMLLHYPWSVILIKVTHCSKSVAETTHVYTPGSGELQA